jgi:hypothetical protein
VDVASAANLGGFSVQSPAPSLPTWTTAATPISTQQCWAPAAPGGVRVRHAAAVSSVPPEVVLVTAAATIAALPGFTFWRCWFASAAMAMAMFRP